MNIYVARYNNAVKIARKINEYIEKGFTVFDDLGEQVQGFKIDETGVYEIVGSCGLRIHFMNDPTFDNGALDTIKEYNDKYKDWKIIDPKHIKKLFGGRKNDRQD